MRLLFFPLALFAFLQVAIAVEPDEILADPALEARARALSEQVRCVVCQNESIESSSAGIARDLRLLIRERLVAGDSDADVLDFLVTRYGEFVLLEPPFRPGTWLLWFAPPLILVAGGILVLMVLRRRRAGAAPQPLDEAEKARLKQLLDREGA